MPSSVIVRAAHVERIGTNEPEHDSILVVHPYRVKASKVSGKCVQAVPGRHPQIVERRHGIDLIQFSSDDITHRGYPQRR